MSLEASAATIERGGQTIVTEASAAVERGRVTALVGPNGAGKSTLLRALGGELPAARGRIALDGVPLSDFTPLELARRRSVMAQATSVVFDFTVGEILDLGWLPGRCRTDAEHRAATRQVARECQIEPLMTRTYNTLSGGERQRVQFARCLLQIWQPPDPPDWMGETRYILLDEPTASLDLAHELLVLRLARQYARRGAGVLIVLHDLNLAARFCDDVVLMFDGCVVDSGEPAEVFADELLSDVYATAIRVEWHDTLERVVVHT